MIAQQFNLVKRSTMLLTILHILRTLTQMYAPREHLCKSVNNLLVLFCVSNLYKRLVKAIL